MVANHPSSAVTSPAGPRRPAGVAGRRLRRHRLAVAAAAAAAILWTAGAARAQTSEQHQGMEMGQAPTMVFRAFGAIDWGATQMPDTPNSFTIGQFDMFLTSALSDRISVLAEAVLEGGTNTRVIVDLERLEVTFRFNDYLRLSAGRFHTGLGYYNTAFHHAAFFETPTERPRVYKFEDEGGVLAVHDVGLSLRGVVPRTGSSLRYLAEVGNGRKWTESDADATETRDENSAKAINVGLSFRPEAWRGLEIGTSYYRDTIPRPSQSAVLHEVIVAYAGDRARTVEGMGEWLWLNHEADGARHDNTAGYLQLSRAWGPLRPYYRYDRQSISPDTPLIGGTPSYSAHIAGLRIDPLELLGVKVEYQRADEAGHQSVDSIRTQLVFVF